MIEETMPEALDGERVDRVVSMLTGCSRAEASESIDAGDVTVDGRVASKSSLRVRVGQRVTVSDDPHKVQPLPEPDASIPVEVVAADEHIIVVNKPAGLVVHPGAGRADGTLVNGLLARWPELADVGEAHRPGIVHRLDKGTSGLMVVARTQTAYHALVDQLSVHEVERNYETLVWGWLDTPVGTIDAPIGRSRRNPLLMTVSADGRPSRTHYEVVERCLEPALVTRMRCSLETGRTHQIRVHLRSIGHPVVGDDLYSGQRPALGLARPFLHAFRLAFAHPATDETVSFTAELPSDLVAVLDRLEPAPDLS
ncbi:MAG TPA: RluA family pseudouridine synthase [Microthrixaceae bacterium]|nr:RluA family pseudouridine synthase [Microthrixaceae bacterium]HMT25797.1 RluA family pseudouridine synthase [Microthrixaceae bacterium]HMT60410.1 RluA family pseudouridine synthase [Microthrixaceae bacterium]